MGTGSNNVELKFNSSGFHPDTSATSYENKPSFRRYAPLQDIEHCTKVLKDLLTIPPFDLGRRDFALQNLLCAKGLLEKRTLSIPKCLARLDELTTYAKNTMDKNIHRFKANPAAYENCEPMWRMSSLVTSMKRDFGAKYDPEIANDILNGKGGLISDSSKFFINGLLDDDPNKRWGTCASLPVLVTAIARRLGYPVGLACAGRHIYAKWEDKDLTFNIEASNPAGMTIPTDQEYQQYVDKPQNFKMKSANNGYYLRTLYPAEEFGLFFSIRVECLLDAARYEETLLYSARALQLAPEDPQFPYTAHYALDLAMNHRIWKTQPDVKIPPMDQPFAYEPFKLLQPHERSLYLTIVAHRKEVEGEIEEARGRYEAACRVKFDGVNEQRDLQRFTKKYGPRERIGPLLPPKGSAPCRRFTLSCKPEEEAAQLRKLAKQFIREGEYLKARAALHDLYIFDPADAGVFEQTRQVEKHPVFHEQEKAFLKQYPNSRRE